MAMQIARMKAGVQPLTSKPLNNLSASFIMIADTINLIRKDNNPRVRIFSGSLIRKPTVAFKIPTTRATPMAVP